LFRSSAPPQELTRKFAPQRLRREICRSFLHPAAMAAIRRSGRNKSGVAATSRRGPRLQFESRVRTVFLFVDRLADSRAKPLQPLDSLPHRMFAFPARQAGGDNDA